MNAPYFQHTGWMQTLEKESLPPFEHLMSIHDTLMGSRDSYIRYNAAWAALYASQKDDERAGQAFDQAVGALQCIAQSPVTAEYEWTSREMPLRADFALALAPQLQTPGKIFTPEQRETTYDALGTVIAKTLSMAEQGSTDARGLLSEELIAALCWRPLPLVFSKFNTVPAGPAKDSRQTTRYATDLYAHHPTIESTKKQRVNLQVKTTLRVPVSEPDELDPMVNIGLNEVVHYEGDEELRGYEAARLLAETILKEISGERLTEQEDDTLLFTMAEIYDRVVSKAESKREGLANKKKRKIARREARV